MPTTETFYDLFIIYHASDIRFVRRVDGHMKANGLICWVSWEDLSSTLDGQAVLKSGILRSHTVAIALSPKSAESQVCNELIQYAVNNSKRFVTLIVDENIDVDVHPAIAENPYIFFRHPDEMEEGIQELLDLMVLDDHVVLHTELLVYANDWDARNRNTGLLLPLDRVNEARDWLAQGANQHPKPSQLQVEYIHASRRQKSNRRWGLSIYVVMGLAILILAGLVISLFQSAQTNQTLADSRSTDVAIQISTSDANALFAESVAGSATAEAVIVEDFSQTATSALALADMAINSASTADAMQQTAQAQSDTAINQASTALTAQAESETLLVVAETESENSTTLVAQVLTAEFESERLVETAQSAQSTSLMMAQTATFVMFSANEQAQLAQTQVANLATVEANATVQLATATAVQLLSDSNAGTAIAFEQIAETEANGRSTAEAELEAINDTATQAFETALEVNSQALIFSAEQALDAGDVELALVLALSATKYVDDSPQIYRIVSRASELLPSLSLSDVAQVAIHPQSNQFAIVRQADSQVLIYDAATREIKFELNGHEDTVTTLKYSLDGEFLMTASQDGMVIIWSATTGSLLHSQTRHQGAVSAIAMHPDGQRMVTAGIRPMLILWDIRSGNELANFLADFGEESLPDKLIFSSDGSRLIGWSNSRGETIMSQWSGETLDLLTNDSGGRVYVGYDPSGELAWTGGRALPDYPNDPNVGDFVLWDIGSGQQRLRLTEGFNWTVLSGTDIATSTDSLLFAIFQNNQLLLGIQSNVGGQRVVLVNLEEGRIQQTYQTNLTTQITSADFIDENRILSTTRDNRLVIWSAQNGTLLQEVGLSSRALQNIQVSTDKTFTLAQSSNGDLYTWSLEQSTQGLSQIIVDAVTGTALNQTGDRLLIKTDNTALLQAVDTQDSLVTFDDAIESQMNDEGTHFAVMSDGEIAVYDARTGIEQQSWSVPFIDTQQITVSPNGKHLVTQTLSDEIWLMRDDSEGAIALDYGDISPAFSTRFSQDDSLFVTLHAENAILWETATASIIQQFPLGLPSDSPLQERVKVSLSDDNEMIFFFVQLDNNIAGLTAFQLNSTEVIRQTFVDVQQGTLTTNGNYLLLALTDNSIQIVDTTSGEILRRLVGHRDRVQTMVYQPANALLFSGSSDNQLILWDVEDGVIVQSYRHPYDVIAIDSSVDSLRILSQTAEGIYRLWQRETLSQLVDRIQSTLSIRDLTCTEREQYNILPLCQ